jgi:hypothetical protein
MAGFFRNDSDRTPLLRGNLPVSSGPSPEAEPVPVAERAPAAPRREGLRSTLAKVAGPAAEVLPPSERKAAMSGLDETERKWSLIGLIVDTIIALLVTIYLAVGHPNKTVTVDHKKTLVPLSGSYVLLGAVVVAICIIGVIAWQRRKRTLVAFAFFLSGFAFTLVFAPFGLALILMGGWLMLRAYRIQKYGTANARQAAQEARNRPRGQSRKAAAATAARTTPSGKKAPTASKRYTPKAAPRKRPPPKPTD